MESQAVSSHAQCSAGSAGVDHSQLDWEAEMAMVARQKISPAHGEHGAGFDEVDLSRTSDGIGGRAGVSGVVERKCAAAGHGGVRGDLVAVIDENAGTDMEASVEGKPVVVRFRGTETQLAVVGDSVFVEVLVVTEDVEAAAEV